ncbi:MAG: AraC family transcriptional regulator [Flammeovirgaceae bacterium]|nr:AraC family transcriptional regulator [Flammeovirgaceae bacterium]MDW8288059.1 AraC family transcriptional regulator [Flammeovirgaceae bacterium]
MATKETILEDYNRIIESLNIKFVRARRSQVLKTVQISNYYDVHNTLLFVEAGEVFFGEKEERCSAGEVLFLPGGKLNLIRVGEGKATVLNNENFLARRDEFLNSKYQSFENKQPEKGETRFTTITFDVKAFESVNFFTSLEIPAFVISDAKEIAACMTKLFYEFVQNKPGRIRCITIFTEELVIDLFRHILSNSLFVEKIATNTHYFKDPRLLDIFNYIKNNISGDLSNKVLASIANVSEDYVGQYFKMLTGINPQDYIEYQRMEKAIDLLRTTKKNIRTIGKEVGYRDTAYFCRRFKMMFGIPAGKMRKRENLVEI